jgi:hypothetical protein
VIDKLHRQAVQKHSHSASSQWYPAAGCITHGHSSTDGNKDAMLFQGDQHATNKYLFLYLFFYSWSGLINPKNRVNKSHHAHHIDYRGGRSALPNQSFLHSRHRRSPCNFTTTNSVRNRGRKSVSYMTAADCQDNVQSLPCNTQCEFAMNAPCCN